MKTKSGLLAKIKKYRFSYILLLPGLIYFIVFAYIPMMGIFIAFKDVSPFDGIAGMISSEWVGLKHFERFFNSALFGTILGNTIIISLLKIVWGFPAPIILALLFNEIRNKYFKKSIQTISYLPHFISMVIFAGIIQDLLSTNGGAINEIVKLFGGEPIYFLGDPKYFRSILVVSDIWKSIGWGSIIYLAAITGIDQEQYEAAEIDGASRFRQTLHITLPSITGTIVIMLILRVGTILSAGFDQVYMLYSPAVYEVGDIIDTYVYREGIELANYSYSTAVGLFKSIVGAIMVIATNSIAKKLGHQGVW